MTVSSELISLFFVNLHEFRYLWPIPLKYYMQNLKIFSYGGSSSYEKFTEWIYFEFLLIFLFLFVFKVYIPVMSHTIVIILIIIDPSFS